MHENDFIKKMLNRLTFRVNGQSLELLIRDGWGWSPWGKYQNERIHLRKPDSLKSRRINN